MADRFVEAWDKAFEGTQQRKRLYGNLGRQNATGHPDGPWTFVVPGRPSYVFVTLRLSNGAQTAMPARNDAGVAWRGGLAVEMQKEGTTYVIVRKSGRQDLSDAPPSDPSGIEPHSHRHSLLYDLDEDDHLQYHNDTRGDIRYYRKDQHINVSTGVADAGKPIVLDAFGLLDASFIDPEDIQDIVGSLFIDSSSIDFTYSDVSNTVTAVVIDEYIQDLIGLMFSGNTETLITVTYQDSDGTIDLVVDDSTFVHLAGTETITGAKTFSAALSVELIKAIDGDGLRIEDDGGNLGIFIEDGGQVGINQPTPLQPLHAGPGNDAPTTNNTNVVIYASRDGTTAIVARDSVNDVETAMIAASTGFGLFGTQTSHPLTLRTNGVDKGIVTESGDFGFGLTTTASVLAKVHILQPTLGDVVQRLESTATNDNPTEDTRQNRVATTDATVTTLHTITIASAKSYLIRAHVVARRTGGASGTANDTAGYGRVATVKDVSGTATLVGAVASLYTMEDQVGWDVTIDVTGATARVRVTGASGNNITWHLERLEVAEVGT